MYRVAFFRPAWHSGVCRSWLCDHRACGCARGLAQDGLWETYEWANRVCSCGAVVIGDISLDWEEGSAMKAFRVDYKV